MSVFIAAVDPGQMTGVCIANATSIIDAWQDEDETAVRKLIRWVQANREAAGCVAIEDQFLGKGIHGSLMVARSSGFVEGALVIAGYPRQRIQWMLPSVWRAEMGLNKGNPKRAEKEEAARMYAKRITGKTFAVSETHMAEAICMSQAAWAKFARQSTLPVWRNSK